MDELGKSLPLAEGFVDAEQAGKTGGEKNCLNCGTPLTGKYCSSCGQRNLPARQDLGDLLINFISSFYSFESKFFKTFQYLLFRPGKIVADYNAGKRESYYHPARMYVFLSFIFFLFVSIFASTDKLNLDGNGDFVSQDSVTADSIKTVVDSIVAVNTKGNWIAADSEETDSAVADSTQQEKELKVRYSPVAVNTGTTKGKTLAEYDSIQAALPEDQRDNFASRYFNRKAREIEARGKDKEKEMTKQFIDDTVSNIPRMLFFLMPLLALLLKIIYIRRDYFYSEHLIFTVFYYNFIYLTGAIVLLVQQVEWLSWLQYVLYLWMLIYLYKAMRNVYKQRRAKTVFKFMLLTTSFFFLAMFGFVALFLIAFSNL
jgi:hypothetical protein